MPEQEGYFKGIRDEDGRFAESKYARRATAFLMFAEHFRSKEITFLGEHFPQDGSAIIIPNHPEGIFGVTDVPLLAAQEGREVDMVVKETLVFPMIQESAAVLEATKRTGGDVFSSGSATGEKVGIKRRAKKVVFGQVRKMVVPYVRDTVNAIPVDRTGKSFRKSAQALERADQTIASGRMVVVPLQWTRTPQHSLKNVKDFAGKIVERNKGVPVYVVAQVVDENKIKHLIVDKPFVPELLESEMGRVLRAKEYTDLFTDSMERLLLMEIPSVER